MIFRISSAGRAGLACVAVERHSKRARLESCVVHDLAVEEKEGVGSAW